MRHAALDSTSRSFTKLFSPDSILGTMLYFSDSLPQRNFIRTVTENDDCNNTIKTHESRREFSNFNEKISPFKLLKGVIFFKIQGNICIIRNVTFNYRWNNWGFIILIKIRILISKQKLEREQRSKPSESLSFDLTATSTSNVTALSLVSSTFDVMCCL